MLDRRKLPRDRFVSYFELAATLQQDCDYSISSKFGTQKSRDARGYLIAAIHGGNIEPGTSELARTIAGDAHGLYLFEGIEWRGGYHDIHITSNKFDEPVFHQMATLHDQVISVHGCRDDWGPNIMIGGLNVTLGKDIAETLRAAGFSSWCEGHAFPATAPENICNRGRMERGVQIEIPRMMRDDPTQIALIGTVISAVLA